MTYADTPGFRFTGLSESGFMPEPRPLKIAYLCDLSPFESWSYSGGNARILASLQTHVGDVVVLDQSWGLLEPLRRLLHRLPEAVNLRARWRLHLLFSPIIARQVHRALRQEPYDVLFCAYSFHALAAVKKPAGMIQVYTSDATPTTYRQSEIGAVFGSYLSISRVFDRAILAAETRIFGRNNLNLWPSDWLKENADPLYGLTDAQSITVPWGANVAFPPVPEPMPPLSRDTPLRLLLIGRDWFAKGGPLVLEIVTTLRDQGIDAWLDIVGTTPAGLVTDAPVTIYPSLDKADSDEAQLFETLLAQAHFLVQPSFESYGFAFCEASAYGLPSLGLRIGGVPIVEGVNGHALPAGSTARDFTKLIKAYLDTPDDYARLRETSRAEFEEHLNWDAWGRRVKALLRDFNTPSP